MPGESGELLGDVPVLGELKASICLESGVVGREDEEEERLLMLPMLLRWAMGEKRVGELSLEMREVSIRRLVRERRRSSLIATALGSGVYIGGELDLTGETPSSPPIEYFLMYSGGVPGVVLAREERDRLE
jgi:hypothetical protein